MADTELNGMLGDNPVEASNAGGYYFLGVLVMCRESDVPTTLHGELSAFVQSGLSIECKSPRCWLTAPGYHPPVNASEELPADGITEAGICPSAQHVDVYLVAVVNEIG
jgi:hypothetical protein